MQQKGCIIKSLTTNRQITGIDGVNTASDQGCEHDGRFHVFFLTLVPLLLPLAIIFYSKARFRGIVGICLDKLGDGYRI